MKYFAALLAAWLSVVSPSVLRAQRDAVDLEALPFAPERGIPAK
jgi:hypothetical protein